MTRPGSRAVSRTALVIVIVRYKATAFIGSNRTVDPLGDLPRSSVVVCRDALQCDVAASHGTGELESSDVECGALSLDIPASRDPEMIIAAELFRPAEEEA